MATDALKVGELARRTGLSVRTLHHYDEIGLLSPSRRTAAGHRLYTHGDIARLQEIVSLRELGLALDQIKELLDAPGHAPLRTIETYAAAVREQIAARHRLLERLERIGEAVRGTGAASVAELIDVIKEVAMFEKYYTEEQLSALARRREQIGEERIREVEAEWPRLMAEVQAEMEKGTDPRSETVRALARRWMALVEEFTGGDPGIRQSLGTMYESESQVHGMETGPMREMMAYIKQSLDG